MQDQQSAGHPRYPCGLDQIVINLEVYLLFVSFFLSTALLISGCHWVKSKNRSSIKKATFNKTH